jgi:hypothetical protein
MDSIVTYIQDPSIDHATTAPVARVGVCFVPRMAMSALHTSIQELQFQYV